MNEENASIRNIECLPPNTGIGTRFGRLADVCILVGLGLSIVALMNATARERFAFVYLWAFIFVWTIVLGSLFFVALQHLVNAVWSVVIRRVAEMLAAPVWIVAALFVPIPVFALFKGHLPLFPWVTVPSAGESLIGAKALYLHFPFFCLRAAGFFIVWIAFARYFVRGSIRQDEAPPGEGPAPRMRKVSAPFMVIFALTVTLASFDWLMSLDPGWYSTIFGVYIFSGMVVASLSAITLATIWLRSRGVLGQGIVTGEHLYSLGGLLFAFVCFWAYIAFSQFMLIWYGNLSEETQYFVRRLQGGWYAVTILLVFVRFVLPFFLLLSRSAKMDPRRLVMVSILLLVGQFVDLYWLIMPEIPRPAPVFGWPELGPPLLVVGVLLDHVAQFLRRHRLVAIGDPRFEESRHFHL